MPDASLRQLFPMSNREGKDICVRQRILYYKRLGFTQKHVHRLLIRQDKRKCSFKTVKINWDKNELTVFRMSPTGRTKSEIKANIYLKLMRDRCKSVRKLSKELKGGNSDTNGLSPMSVSRFYTTRGLKTFFHQFLYC